MEAGGTVAVLVYAAAGEVVACVTTTVMGSVRVLGVAIRVRVAPRSLEGMTGLREVKWTGGALGIRGSEKVTVLWLDGSAAPLLTVRAAGRGSLSAVAALATMSEWVGMAVRGALAVETVPVP